METVINIDGVAYTFVTQDEVTTLKVLTETTESKDTKPKKVDLPLAWIITRKSGVPLFALKPGKDDSPFRIITAEKLYAEKGQWFEPLARYYRELVWINPETTQAGSESHAAYKHVTWQELIDFAIVDRFSFTFHSGMPGDWKFRAVGGAEFLMVFMEDKPYWTDGIGQVPFAVNTYRKYLRETKQVGLAIKLAGETGVTWGDGKAYTGAERGPKDVYDNFIILRGILWAKENCKLVVKKDTVYDKGIPHTIELTDAPYVPVSNAKLINPISQGDMDQYGAWNK
ncbi:hypothetical protein [Pseudomonas atacamensis]|uniref:hypothetical protein n=1 Tax=Pseudomonas atacamensis TaxID=2565368 RepID=UPI00300F5F20